MAKYDWKYLDKKDIIDNELTDDGIAYWTIHFNVKKMVEYLNKDSKIKKDWWCTSNFGQDHVTLVAEHNMYGVRLFFEFDIGGFCDITRRFMETYETDRLGSWHYSKYDMDYNFDLIKDNLLNYDKKFMESKKNKTMKKSIIRENYKGLNPQDSCDYALSNCDKSMIKQINTLSDAWELYQKSWEKFHDIYSLSDIEEMYLNIEDCLDELHKKVIEKWMEDIDIIYYSNNKMSQIKPTFGFKGNDLFESKKSTMKKSIKEYRTVGLEQEVREKCIEILEDSHSDLFELNYSDAIITYDNKGRAETTSSGDVFINYITLPLYCWSSGSYPSNKDTKKIIDGIIDYNMDYAKERLWDEHEDELKELGIESKDNDNLEYNSLYELGASDLAEKLSEYEMDMEGTELYTDVICGITEVDEGIELEVSMRICDEYAHVLVKNYKSNSVVITEDTKDIEDAILDCIRSVTENW